MHQCIVRLLKNWVPLFNFFLLESTGNKTLNAGDILSNFNNEEIRAYLLFSKFTSDSFNKLNALFQSREIQIHVSAERSRWILDQMAMCFLKPKALDNIKVDSVTPDNILPLLSINVGDECQNFLNSCQSKIGEEVKKNCLGFYRGATREIINRLPYCDEFLLDMRFLNSKIASSDDIRLKFNKLDSLCGKFDLMPLVNLIIAEWVNSPFYLKYEQIQHLSSLTSENMWLELFKFELCAGLPTFSNSQKLVDLVLILPHSNAEAERAFSYVTDIIAKKRNYIGSNTVAAICEIRSNFQANDVNRVSSRTDFLHLTLYDETSF